MMGLVIGITGGIATGKSTVMQMFRALGASILSADEVARDVLASGMPAFDDVLHRFGSEILNSDGEIDRTVLGKIVFDSPDALSDLNSIAHPRIIAILEERIGEFRNSSDASVLVVEIPLLYECNLQYLVNKVVAVVAEQEAQLFRLKTRGFSDEQAKRRVAAQMPVAEKADLADWVIWTDGSMEDTRRQTEQIWAELKSA